MAERPEHNVSSPSPGGTSTKAVRIISRAPPLPPWLGHDWFFAVVLILAVWLVYAPVWPAGFIWDDSSLIVENPSLVGWPGLKEIWTTHQADICPLTLTTIWAIHALWGLTPLPFHLLNLLFHTGCALLLWRVLLALRVPGARLGAALWALHPVQVESVAWVSEMKNTESGLFFLLAILMYIKWLRSPGPDRPFAVRSFYVLSLLCTALALACKLTTVVLPAVLCLCAWWIEGRWRWRNLPGLLPTALLALAAAAFAAWSHGLDQAMACDPHWPRSWPERLVTAGDAVWFYLGKLLWPQLLMTVYPGWTADAENFLSWLPLLAVIAGFSILWLERGTRLRPWFFAFAYFLAALFPALGLLDNFIFRYAPVFDHFQYLASMGPLALAGSGLVAFSRAVRPGLRAIRTVAAAGVLAVLALLTWQRAAVFQSDETLWRDTLEKNPTCWLAHNNYGRALAQTGRIDEALDHFQQSVALYPNYDQAHDNLGNILDEKGRVDEAMLEYRKALALNPANAFVYSNLGNLYFQRGNYDEAISLFQEALRLKPGFATARLNLARAQAAAAAQIKSSPPGQPPP
jgi:tetratricopeptide (TPR) repeat protein